MLKSNLTWVVGSALNFRWKHTKRRPGDLYWERYRIPKPRTTHFQKHRTISSNSIDQISQLLFVLDVRTIKRFSLALALASSIPTICYSVIFSTIIHVHVIVLVYVRWEIIWTWSDHVFVFFIYYMHVYCICICWFHFRIVVGFLILHSTSFSSIPSNATMHP